MKRAFYLVAGLCCFLLGLATAVFGWLYLMGGAGLQVIGVLVAPSPGTVLIGLVHTVGLILLALLFFIIGLGLCVAGICPENNNSSSGTST